MAQESCINITEHLREYTESALDTSWTIHESHLGGRGLFATKPIKKGCLIFANKPLVVGARADIAANMYCSKCYVISGSCLPCEKCQLLLCSTNCKQSQEHSKECDYISRYLEARNKCDGIENPVSLAKVLIYIRFLLLSEEQNSVMKFLQRGSQSSFQELDDLCSRYKVSEEKIQKIKVINSIMKINSFRIANGTNNRKVPIRGLFPLSAFLNHSCLPNTRNVFMEDYTMAVYASQDIGIGEEILSCYTGILWCTPARRLQLYKSKSFWCNCARCHDTTEHGTKLSALKCLNPVCIGVLLPTDPLDAKTPWWCDICFKKVSAERVNMVQSVLGSLVGTLQLDDKFKLENAILDRLASFVPHSNHIFVDIRLRLAIKLGNDGTYLNGIKKRHIITMQAFGFTNDKTNKSAE